MRGLPFDDGSTLQCLIIGNGCLTPFRFCISVSIERLPRSRYISPEQNSIESFRHLTCVKVPYILKENRLKFRTEPLLANQQVAVERGPGASVGVVDHRVIIGHQQVCKLLNHPCHVDFMYMRLDCWDFVPERSLAFVPSNYALLLNFANSRLASSEIGPNNFLRI